MAWQCASTRRLFHLRHGRLPQTNDQQRTHRPPSLDVLLHQIFNLSQPHLQWRPLHLHRTVLNNQSQLQVLHQSYWLNLQRHWHELSIFPALRLPQHFTYSFRNSSLQLSRIQSYYLESQELTRYRQRIDLYLDQKSLVFSKQRYKILNIDAYWRGPVWININYLFLRGLKLYYPQ